ncbi:F-box domain-containing protein [Oryctes borbonicus]|uniref:F-box domain-containing protein n=1 Tax=Oryctes borbonicus TaxID=1629725 RepID=A0A0T6B6K3_9SCAR|nr:F-box domain-containing protein [Oryctes borbonicus]
MIQKQKIMLPSETIERILSFCDGRTLYNARHVNQNWRQIVDYLTVKTKIWKYCCYEEISPDQMIEYLERFNVSPADDKFKLIYENWLTWKDITNNVDFDIMLCPADIPRITCLAAAGRFIAVGSEDGKVRLYNDSWDFLYTTRHVAVKVLDITFFDDDRDLYMGSVWPFIIIYYKCSTLYLMDYEDRFVDPFVVHDVKLYSVYKKYLCLVKTGGRISIVEWKSHPDGRKRLLESTYVRIYSPNEVTGVSIWNGLCLFLMNSDVKTLQYDIQPITTVEKKTRLKFCIKNDIRMEQTCQIFRRNIIISLSNDKDRQLMELFILGSSREYSKKLFHPWEVLESSITCMYLYGNTFILGVDIGDVCLSSCKYL